MMTMDPGRCHHNYHHQISHLDCPNGLKCNNYECEHRHLDKIEMALRNENNDVDGLSRNSATKTIRITSSIKPNIIVTASPDMGRTASTWVFNAVRLLYRQAQISCDSYWIRQLSKDKLQHRLNKAMDAAVDDTPAVVLVKTHEQYMCNTEFEKDIVPMLTHVIVSTRAGFPTDQQWMKYATHVTKYEDIVAHTNDSNQNNVGALKVLREIANHLQITDDVLSEDDLRKVDYQLMTLPIPGDQSTKFWSFHSRRGGRPVPEFYSTS